MVSLPLMHHKDYIHELLKLIRTEWNKATVLYECIQIKSSKKEQEHEKRSRSDRDNQKNAPAEQ